MFSICVILEVIFVHTFEGLCEVLRKWDGDGLYSHKKCTLLSQCEISWKVLCIFMFYFVIKNMTLLKIIKNRQLFFVDFQFWINFWTTFGPLLCHAMVNFWSKMCQFWCLFFEIISKTGHKELDPVSTRKTHEIHKFRTVFSRRISKLGYQRLKLEIC